MKVLAGSLILLFVFFAGAAQAQQTRGGSVSPTLFGSVTQGTPTSGVIPLSISDAIDRALKYNLGMIVSEQESQVSRASRLRALSDLLPKMSAGVTETVQQTNLAAFGFGGFPGTPPVVGPFSVFDARARYSHSVFDFRLLHDFRAAAERLNASNYSQQDVRELVVLIATNLYLEAVAGSTRVEAARAQLNTAQAVYDRATNLKDSGVAAGIDVLRAQVQLQAQRQRVLAMENELAKQKLNLARAIGLPQGQEFSQTDRFATGPPVLPNLEEALTTALDARPDYRRASALIRSAEEARKSAIGRSMPSFQVNADYGDIGRNPAFSHGTMTLQGTVSIPIYNGGRTRAELLESEAVLEQRRVEATNLRDRIEYEIRTASLDIQSAAEQVRVAQAAMDLAQQQLLQAQDRFAAGVATSLEIVQGQEAIVTADENYISGLYSLNLAQTALARAMGSAEKTIKTSFGGK